MLVAELAIKHQYFLAPAVLMRRKTAVRGIANDRRGTRNFVTHPVEHHALDTGRR